MAPILRTSNISVDAVPYPLTERFNFRHLLISVKSFLASLSLLDGFWDITERCPSIPVLFCDAMLGYDPYRNRSETSVARVIMEHIDTHHSSISHEVNIELGSKHLGDPLPEVSDNQCQCPLQRLDMSDVSRSCPQAVVEAAYRRLIEVEEFVTLQQLVDPLTAAKYFHLFENRILRLVQLSKDLNKSQSRELMPDDHSCFISPRARRMRPTPINGPRPRLALNPFTQMPKEPSVQRQDEVSEESENRNRVTEMESTARSKMGFMVRISTTKTGLCKSQNK
ncbi:hypothetical protein CC78DRAFT_546543 [Lojkania enalia]|uniref:Uncharacterized protein n=1 Tax=Lojkania enalia TaxID=147567 RepID=A0A9P4K2S3_9PLEO|nr:hypothetical protein CC78DRAFT_546543 [Didymosphaeria enalia]